MGYIENYESNRVGWDQTELSKKIAQRQNINTCFYDKNKTCACYHKSKYDNTSNTYTLN